MQHSSRLRHAIWPTMLVLVVTLWVGCGPSVESQQRQVDSTGTEKRTEAAQGEATPASEPGAERNDDSSAEPSDPGTTETAPEAGKVTRTAGPTSDPVPEADPAPWTEPEKEPDLGPPLVDNREDLRPLDPPRPVWIDTKNKRVIVVGQICRTEAGLELFACLRNTKEHEAIVTVGVQAATVHAGLVLLGAEAGHPARWDPEYRPATGTEIEVSVVWKDKQGKRRTARAQDWIREAKTGKAMTHPFVFAGSGFWKDEETSKEYYQAEGGDFICVSNFTTAMLDVPIESSQANDALMFHAFTERIPPRGTPVTLILTPKLRTATPHEISERATPTDRLGSAYP